MASENSLSLSVSSLSSQPGPGGISKSAPARGIGILVMGLTGAGKSTFISQITQQHIEIGHSLESCTTAVYGYRYFHTNGQEIWLIDTPGFDDTNKANAQVLGEIASFLCTFCSNHKLIIGGMLYIHRITDIRMSNSSLRSLRIFEALCGDACFGDVTVVTTMWDMLRSQDALQSAETREATLRSRPNFFGRLMQGGAQYARHRDTRTSSIDIIEAVANRNRDVTLALQKELELESTTTLADTTVGKYLEGDLRNMRKRFETKIAQLKAYNNDNSGEDEDMTAAVQSEKELMVVIDSDIGFLHLPFEKMRNDRGVRMLEGRSTTANADDPSVSESIQEGIRANMQHSSLPQAGTEANESIGKDYQIHNRTENAIRPNHGKNKPKEDSAWTNFLRALSKGSGKALSFETRRSNSLPPEAIEHRVSRVSRPKRLSQHRERRVDSKSAGLEYSAQATLYENWPAAEPGPFNQDPKESDNHQISSREVLFRSQHIAMDEFRSSYPETTTSYTFPAKIHWESSGLPRSYPNDPSINQTLRYSSRTTEEQTRDLYHRSFNSDQ